jgi:hypothetical protein
MSVQNSDYDLFASRAYFRYINQTGNFTASPGGIYGIDTTSGSVTCTVPSNPNDGDWFIVFDVAKMWGTNQAVIGSSSNNFIDTINTSPTAGPYDLNAVPYSGQSLIRFVWAASTSVWSVN